MTMSKSNPEGNPCCKQVLLWFCVLTGISSACWIVLEMFATPLVSWGEEFYLWMLPVRLICFISLFVAAFCIACLALNIPVPPKLTNFFTWFPFISRVLALVLLFNGVCLYLQIAKIFITLFDEDFSAPNLIGSEHWTLSTLIFFVGVAIALIFDLLRLKLIGPPKGQLFGRQLKMVWWSICALLLPQLLLYKAVEGSQFPVLADIIHVKFFADRKEKLTRELMDKVDVIYYKYDRRLIQKYLDQGADIEGQAADHGTPLMIAAAAGDLDFVKDLLERGANPNAKKKSKANLGPYNFYDATPLIYAIYYDRPQVFELLLSKGADANAKNIYGTTALMVAAKMANPIYFDTLMRYGASVSGKNASDITVISNSICSDDPERFNKVIALGATVDAHERSGNFALAQAITHKNAVAAKWLINQGVPVRDGHIRLAKSEQYRDCNMLEVLGVKVDAKQ